MQVIISTNISFIKKNLRNTCLSCFTLKLLRNTINQKRNHHINMKILSILIFKRYTNQLISIACIFGWNQLQTADSLERRDSLKLKYLGNTSENVCGKSCQFSWTCSCSSVSFWSLHRKHQVLPNSYLLVEILVLIFFFS